MIDKFIALAQTGKNEWWRYLLGILLTFFSWQVVGVVPFILLAVFLQSDSSTESKFNPQISKFEGVEPIFPYIGLNLAFVCFLIGLYIAVRFIHQRRFITLVTPSNKINWSRILQGIGVWWILATLISVIESIISPENYQLTFNPGSFLIFVPIALVLTSLQASTEELFFRGYLMQGIGLTTRKAIIPIVVTSILFMLPHLLNPEVKAGFYLLATYYLLLALFLAFITVKDNSLELALAAHIGNNLFAVLFVNYTDSALPSPSVFTIQKIDPVYNLVSSLVIFAGFYWFFFIRKTSERRSN
ncbi:CPBP family intramembrane metalloprotease [Microcoleus sp. FACHB-SPT15]|uniref:CPBP family intramembrane glutamic endopeptidase n=1 Tax=Microcoleus sp. FACHB-SPT15 TaxID=2692830 RepID=UPI0017864995|nr:CPBP family intramembrane glutamic endopeptidase [Microcoleus sp. FACHB-SPT15]MBD1805420.1 CPBP family intramembrane metalloprotease [Microcoleus sp. FACHB-SPT15]